MQKTTAKRPEVKKNGARIVFPQFQKSGSLIELLEWENKKEGTGLRVAVNIENLNNK